MGNHDSYSDCVIDDEVLRDDMRDTVRSFDEELYAERPASAEAGVLVILADFLKDGSRSSIPVSEITAAFVAQFGQEYDRLITNRYIGGILRKRFRLVTFKSHGVYAVPATEKPKVDHLCLRYGVSDRSPDRAVTPWGHACSYVRPR